MHTDRERAGQALGPQVSYNAILETRDRDMQGMVPPDRRSGPRRDRRRYPRFRACSTFAPGRPVGRIPIACSIALMASRVFWPTLPSGSPTS
jgi:hypothetical protein